MNDFLDRVWLDNPIKHYLIIGGVIMATMLFKQYLAQYCARFIFAFFKTIWKEIDRKTFVKLLARPLSIFLLILITVASLHRLQFPAVLNVELYRVTVKEVLHFSAAIVIIVFFIKLLINILEFIALLLHKRALQTPTAEDNQIIIFFKDFIKAMLIIIGVLLILKYAFGYKVGQLLTGLSLVSAAVAFALRESIENLIASFIIFFDKPFSVGDIVKVHGLVGVVEKIGLRSTKVRSDQKTFLTIPNKQMVDTIVDNYSLRTLRRADIKIELDESNSIENIVQVTALIKTEIEKHEVENVMVHLGEILQSSYNIQIEYYTGTITITEFNQIKEQIHLSIIRLIKEQGLVLYKPHS